MSPSQEPSSPPIISPAPSQDCIPKVLDFSGLANGQYVFDDLQISHCVNITAFANKVNGNRRGFTPIGGVHQPAGGAARVFDTGVGSNCDEDLLTPSPKFFGGPEFGPPVTCNNCCGGAEYVSVFDPMAPDKCKKKLPLEPNPFKNDKYLGNVLIIQERRPGEPNSCPDDTAAGGSITFDFCEPVFFQTLELLDVDFAESATLVFHYSTAAPPKTVAVPKTGDNGVFIEDYNESHVIKLEVVFSGSGSVSALYYLLCEDTASPTLSPTEVPSSNSTQVPTTPATVSPTSDRTQAPTFRPTGSPSVFLSGLPTGSNTATPNGTPTESPTVSVTALPTISPLCPACPTGIATFKVSLFVFVCFLFGPNFDALECRCLKLLF
jgi:hypothetical protein